MIVEFDNRLSLKKQELVQEVSSLDSIRFCQFLEISMT